jgi:UDP-GlcNAc:undecaprenyl-phosphate GlcNAc-1-phosphate transferase
MIPFEPAYTPRFIILILAWFVADLITPVIVWLSFKIDALDKPHSYKIHTKPVPFLGGLCIYIAFTIAIFSILRFTTFEANKELFAIMLGGFILLIINCIDDFRKISAVIKLIILLVVTIFLTKLGVVIKLSQIDVIDICLTCLWVAGISSAINSLDNMDGVATGISAIAAFFTFLITWLPEPWQYKQLGVSYFSFALFGACLGFLRYNYKPAKIFLGDNGAMVVGFLLATMMVFAGWAKDDPLKAVVIPCSILVVPLYDITLSTILRIKNRVVKNVYQAIVYCGQDHLYHRLVGIGLKSVHAIWFLYGFGVAGGLIGFLISQKFVTPVFYIPIVITSIALLIILGIILDKAKVYKN